MSGVRVLVLGGTWFVGLHLVEQAVAAGHEVTVFHRGRRAVDLPAGVRALYGDREDHRDLQMLAGLARPPRVGGRRRRFRLGSRRCA